MMRTETAALLSSGKNKKDNKTSSNIFFVIRLIILGGTTTLVGTPPNILAGDLLRERGLAPFTLFDFTPLGVILLGVIGLVALHAWREPTPVARNP